MITFQEYVQQRDSMDEGLKSKIAAGLGLLAAGAGAGYGLRGTGTVDDTSKTYPAAADFMPQQVQVAQPEMDYESLVQDYMQKNKSNPKYTGTIGKNFRNLRQDAEKYAANVIAKQKMGDQSGRVDFSHEQGKVTGDNYTAPNAKEYLKKSGSVDD